MTLPVSRVSITDARVTFHLPNDPTAEATLNLGDSAVLHLAEVPADLYFQAAGGVEATLSTDSIDPITTTVTPIRANDPLETEGDARVLAGAAFEVEWPDEVSVDVDAPGVSVTLPEDRESVVDDNCETPADAFRMAMNGRARDPAWLRDYEGEVANAEEVDGEAVVAELRGDDTTPDSEPHGILVDSDEMGKTRGVADESGRSSGVAPHLESPNVVPIAPECRAEGESHTPADSPNNPPEVAFSWGDDESVTHAVARYFFDPKRRCISYCELWGVSVDDLPPTVYPMTEAGVALESDPEYEVRAHIEIPEPAPTEYRARIADVGVAGVDIDFGHPLGGRAFEEPKYCEMVRFNLEEL